MPFTSLLYRYPIIKQGQVIQYKNHEKLTIKWEEAKGVNPYGQPDYKKDRF